MCGGGKGGVRMETTSIVSVIRSVRIVGAGVPEDPTRTIVQYWSLNGELLAELDFNDDPYSPLRQ